LKPYRINHSPISERAVTHGEIAGLSGTRIRGELKNFFTQRRFYHRIPLHLKEDMMLWFRGLPTPMKSCCESVPRYVRA
ncbi:MAG: hypothetical protein GY863_24960, partial [bacterium]|nr:hypothetical protein [bacterium]